MQRGRTQSSLRQVAMALCFVCSLVAALIRCSVSPRAIEREIQAQTRARAAAGSDHTGSGRCIPPKPKLKVLSTGTGLARGRWLWGIEGMRSYLSA